MFVAELKRRSQPTEMDLRLSRKHDEYDVARPQIMVARIILADQSVTDEHPVHAITFDHTAVLTEPSYARLGVRDRAMSRRYQASLSHRRRYSLAIDPDRSTVINLTKSSNSLPSHLIHLGARRADLFCGEISTCAPQQAPRQATPTLPRRTCCARRSLPRFVT